MMGGRQPRPRGVVSMPNVPPPPVSPPPGFIFYRGDWWQEGRTHVTAEDLGVEIGDPWPIVLAPKDLPPFTGYEPCPRCGRWDLHWLERASSHPPTVLTVTPQVREVEATVQAWGYRYVSRNVHRWADPIDGEQEPDRWLYRLSRADERGFDVIRRCRHLECQHRWPEGRATVNAVRQHQPKE